jgi:hypothetical protein
MDKENVLNIEELVQDSHNFNKGTEGGAKLMERSLKELGAGRSILIDKNGNIIAGNKTQEAAIKAGIRKINFSTDLCYTFLDTIFATPRDKVGIDLFMKDAVAAVKQFAISKIRLLDANNKI